MNNSDTTSTLELIDFEEAYASYFKDLNVAWLQQYFYVEPIDEEMLSNPQQYIIEQGGAIYFAKWKNTIVGTFALLPIENGVYELGKMAVADGYKGQKFGNAIVKWAIEKAMEKGAHKLILLSNTSLAPAIHLYKKYGFIEVPLGTTEYKRANIKMEKEL